ncbi:class I SAM-dependent methyltransferase [Streptomyces sp. NPDC051569]|uniref:class I SAM-dependent methyltransferase n=1 Tax=Streptomyces sp. NPDC051569 TaxID=3365661 RepID=UPI0037935374
MSFLLRNRLTKRIVRPAATHVDRRVDKRVDKRMEQRVDRRVDQRVDQRAKPAVDALRTDLETLRREVAELRRHQYATSLLFDRTGRVNDRVPNAAEVDTLVREIAELTGEDSAYARRDVTVAFRNVVALEALGVGRLAGTTYNVCGKLAAVPLLAPPNEDVLEIGTLHGLFAATLTRMLHRAGLEARLTIVDPLAGSQLQPGAKQGAEPTGTPVRMDVVRANLALAGRAGAEARIQRGLSGDPEVRAAVSDRRYGVIVVDGDHSKEGVLADLEWVEEIIAPGGIVVVDDYGDKSWPGVQQAADQHLAGGASRLEMLGRAATSAFLRARA